MTTQINESFNSTLGEFLCDTASAGYGLAYPDGDGNGFCWRTDSSNVQPAIMYSDCGARCTLDTTLRAPGLTTADYVFKLVYRYQSSTNYRYVRICFNNGSLTAYHWKCIAGTHTQLDTSSGHSAYYSEGDTIRFRMLLNGTNVRQLRITAPGYDSDNPNNTIDADLQSETHVGFYLDPVQTYYANNTGTDSFTRSILVDKFRADDVLIYDEPIGRTIAGGNTHGIIVGGNSTVVQSSNKSIAGGSRIGSTNATTKQVAINSVGGLLSGGSQSTTKTNPISTQGGTLVGATQSTVRNTALSSAGGLLAGGGSTIVHNHSYVNNSAGGLIAGGSSAIIHNHSYVNDSAGGILVGSGNTYGVLIPKSSSGGLLVGSANTATRNTQVASTGGIVVDGINRNAGVAATGGLYLGGSSTIVIAYSSTYVGGLTLAGDSGNSTSGKLSIGGSNSAIAQYSNLSVGGLLLSASQANVGNLSVGGSSTLNWIQAINSVGGLSICGNKYPNGYANRQTITIPANTFASVTDYFIGIKEMNLSPDLQVTDSAGNVIGHTVRSSCPSGITHIFFTGNIIDPAHDSVWYLYS